MRARNLVMGVRVLVFAVAKSSRVIVSSPMPVGLALDKKPLSRVVLAEARDFVVLEALAALGKCGNEFDRAVAISRAALFNPENVEVREL